MRPINSIRAWEKALDPCDAVVREAHLDWRVGMNKATRRLLGRAEWYIPLIKVGFGENGITPVSLQYLNGAVQYRVRAGGQLATL